MKKMFFLVLPALAYALLSGSPARALDWTLATDVGGAGISGVFALDENNVWAVSREAAGEIYHFNGTVWTLETATGVSNRGVSARASDDVWVAADEGKVFHYDGSWKEDTDFGYTANNRVFAEPDAGVFVGADSGFLWYYTGSDWELHTDFGYNDNVVSFYSRTGSGIWALTNYWEHYSRIYKFELNWVVQTTISGSDLRDLTVPEVSAARAVGGINSPTTGHIFRRSGPSSWSLETSFSQRILQSVWSANADHIWTCGGQGAIYLYNGTSWTLESDTSNSLLLSIHGFSPDRVWAGGSDGEIYSGRAVSPPPAGGWIYDYNGDGTSDIAIFRADSGIWAVRGITRAYFGGTNDYAAPGDYNGDGTTELGIFRDSAGLWAARGVTRAYFGTSYDLPEQGDYDGDGTWDFALFRGGSGLWAVRNLTRAYFGGSGDAPVPGYYGGGAVGIGIFRDTAGLWAARGVTRLYFGGVDDTARPGDYDGDGTWDFALFREASGLWAVRNLTRAYFGGSGDFAAPGDYTGDGTDTIGIFRNLSGLWALRGVSRFYFGGPSDIAVVR